MTANIFRALFSITLLLWSCNKNSDDVEIKIDKLLSQMTLEEKVSMISGVNTFETNPVLRLGIPSLIMTDISGGGKRTAFPVGVALAASWDTALIRKVGMAAGNETKALGKNVLLYPCVNIHRLPGGGRNFESFGEDPHLAAALTVSYINGVQQEGVAATVKHFACNNQEYDRLYIDAHVDERLFMRFISGF
ncbi:MAG: glycoside hydrolase family 3 protein [Bacteroidales bacterium]|nr:glycoside hydrolase family 3 protein [Bacteroidales bacterium]